MFAVVAAGALATGRVSYVTTSGVSMLPLYHQGDLVVVVKSESYKVGEIAAYRVPAKHLVILHRIIGRAGAGFIMKGDNNESIDPTHPTSNLIVGHAVLLIPDGGIWVKWLTSPAALILIVILLLSSGGTAVHTRQRRNKTSTPKHRAVHHRRYKANLVDTAPPWLRAAAAVSSLVVLLGAVLAALAWSGPVSKSVAAAPVKLSTLFSYSATVRQTPAYDSTRVSSPLPVFRKLTNVVDVHYAYEGIPGTMRVTAELTTPSGWRSTVALATPKQFGTTRYDGNVQLNLDSLAERAQAAAAVTGLPPDPLTVVLVARVTGAHGRHFSPSLVLNLSPLELSLVGNPTTLAVEGSAPWAGTTAVPRTFGALGRNLTAAEARAVAVILLVAGLLSAGALTAIALQTVPASEGDGIRRRFASLLVAVDPMPTSPGHSIVGVADFGTLTRLAEHHGSLILHWSRGGVDIFVVQAQGETYRYQVGQEEVSTGPDRDRLVNEQPTTDPTVACNFRSPGTVGSTAPGWELGVRQPPPPQERRPSTTISVAPS